MRIVYHIDEYEKQENGLMKRVWKFKTTSKSEFDTIKYNLSDRIIRTYKKLEGDILTFTEHEVKGA